MVLASWLKGIFRFSRWSIFLFSLLMISGLMRLSSSLNEDRYQQKIHRVQNPADFQGTPICLSHVRLTSVNGKIIGVDRRESTFPLVFNAQQPLMINQIYSVQGIIQSDGNIQVLEYQHHPFRLYKYLFSALSLLLIIVLIYRHIRINRNGWYLQTLEINSPDYLFWKR